MHLVTFVGKIVSPNSVILKCIAVQIHERTCLLLEKIILRIFFFQWI